MDLLKKLLQGASQAPQNTYQVARDAVSMARSGEKADRPVRPLGGGPASPPQGKLQGFQNGGIRQNVRLVQDSNRPQVNPLWQRSTGYQATDWDLQGNNPDNDAPIQPPPTYHSLQAANVITPQQRLQVTQGSAPLFQKDTEQRPRFYSLLPKINFKYGDKPTLPFR